MKTKNQTTPCSAARRNLTRPDVVGIALLALAAATIRATGNESGTTTDEGANAVRPFHVHVSDEALTDLRRRIEAIMREELPGARIAIHVEPENKAKHEGILMRSRAAGRSYN